MVAPGASEPLSYIVDQIKRNISRAADRCGEIYSQQRARSTRTEVDQLLDALGRGRAFVDGEYTTISGLPGTEPDGGDGALRQDLAGYSHRLETIIQKLERYTYPFNVHHDAMHSKHQDHHHHGKLIFPFYVTPTHNHHHHKHRSRSHSPYRNHHRDTLFANQLKEWEDIRDGISQAFARFRDRMETKRRTKKNEDEEKEKAEKKRAEAVDKAKKAEQKETEREKKRAEELKKELEEFRENERELRKKRQAREQKFEDNIHEFAGQALNGSVLAGHDPYDSPRYPHHPYGRRVRSLERDPIDDFDRVARVFRHWEMDRDHPRRSLDGLQASAPAWNHATVLPAASAYCPECWWNRHTAIQHPHEHSHHHHHRRGRSHSTSADAEEHVPPVVIQNVVRGPEVDFEVDEATTTADLPGRRSTGRHRRGIGGGGNRSASADTSSDDSIDVSGHIVHVGHHDHGHHGHQHGRHTYRRLAEPTWSGWTPGRWHFERVVVPDGDRAQGRRHY